MTTAATACPCIDAPLVAVPAAADAESVLSAINAASFLSVSSFIIPGKLESLVQPLLVENIVKLETATSKGLRRPAVMLFVIGNLKKRNPIPFPVPQILSFYKTDLAIRRADSAHYVTANLRRLLLHDRLLAVVVVIPRPW